MTTPDFLCIGAQKAGTTWLDTNVRFHPQVWMPPVKELHYFDRHQSPYIMDMFDSDSRKRGRLVARLSHALRDLAAAAAKPQSFLSRLRWYCRFIFQRRNNHWYVSLFRPGEGQIAGDVTPAYARLSEEAVAGVYELMPKAKVIYLLRDPIERMWSEAAMHFSTHGHRGIGTMSVATIRQFLDQPMTTANSTYMTTLGRWRRFYSDAQLFVGFFEQLCECPRSLLGSIFEFLELPNAAEHIPDTIEQKVHGRSYPPLPGRFACELANRFHDDIQLLHETFSNDYTARWLDRANRYLAQPLGCRV